MGEIPWESQLRDIGMVALSGGLGAIIGCEREIADKPAGLRTHILVSAAATLFMLLADAVLKEFQQDAGIHPLNADPIRIIQAIVIGISFLGAGTIIHQGNHRVEGLTTAASILLTAGIGIAVAVDRLVFATGITLLAVIVLFVVGWVESKLTGKKPAEPDPDESEAAKPPTQAIRS